MKKILKIVLIAVLIFVILTLGIFISNKFKKPSHDRDWAEDSKILPSISMNENFVEIKNIRDWRYSKTDILAKDYYDETFDLDKLSKTYYLINPFGKWNGVAHGFFLFVFEDGKSVSVSIEARREVDESFNSIKGLFNKYELWYAYGSAADFITRRAVHYEDSELNMYPLEISKEMSQSLFLDLALEAQSIEKEARFYNTIKSNCTNLLMDSLNKAEKGSVPFHYSRLFTGYSDDYFYKLGLIPQGGSFKDVNNKSRIDFRIRDIDSELVLFAGDKYLKYSKESFWNKFSDYLLPIDQQVVAEVNEPEPIKYDRFRIPLPSSELVRYEHKEFGIQFYYPSNYSVNDKKYENYISVEYPKETPGMDGPGGLSISSTDLEYEEFKKLLDNPEQYSQIVDEKEFVIDGKTGVLITNTTAIGLDVERVFVKHNGKNLLIGYPSHPVQREIFNSIKFI